MRKVLAFLVLLYLAAYVWPGRFKYDHIGVTPVRTERVTGRVQYMDFSGWHWMKPVEDERSFRLTPPGR